MWWKIMNIILEGPKASGKTTLAELLKKEGYGRVHLDADTKNDYDFHLELLEDNDKTVFDRFSIGEIVYPAADVSEQISTASKEASGTGNMKFMMNGALTIGTYDGANIEILEAVGEENFFLFGLYANQVDELRSNYRPWSYVEQDEDLQGVLDWIRSGHFNQYEPGIFDMILDALLSPHDPWMTLADFRSYVNAQEKVALAWQDPAHWTRMSILNTASSGFFSTDRTMQEYNRDIWKLNQSA